MSRINPAAKAIVLDASIVFKWYRTESDSSTALCWRQRIKSGKTMGVVPDLLFLEVINAMLRQHKLPTAEVQRVIRDLEKLGLEIIATSRISISDITQLAGDHSLSAYDAVYLQLAKVTNYPLLTADRQLLKVAPEETRSLK